MNNYEKYHDVLINAIDKNIKETDSGIGAEISIVELVKMLYEKIENHFQLSIFCTTIKEDWNKYTIIFATYMFIEQNEYKKARQILEESFSNELQYLAFNQGIKRDGIEKAVLRIFKQLCDTCQTDYSVINEYPELTFRMPEKIKEMIVIADTLIQHIEPSEKKKPIVN